MDKEMIYVIVGVIMLVGIIVVLWKYKREYLKVLAYYCVVQAEEEYVGGHGEEKLALAIKTFKSKLHWSIRWLISEKFITGMLENALQGLQGYLKGSKAVNLFMLNNIMDKGASGNISATVEMAKGFKDTINGADTGYVEAFAKVRSDFRDKTEGEVGLKVGKKF